MDAAIIPQSPNAPDGGIPVNRRRTFRVVVVGLSMKAWRMDPHERLIDRPLPSRRIVMSAIDLGRHGAGTVIPTPGAGAPTSATAPVPPALGDRWRVELLVDTAGQSITLEGRVVSVVPRGDNELRVGLAFQEPFAETQVRRINNVMDKLLATLQRAQIRRASDSAA